MQLLTTSTHKKIRARHDQDSICEHILTQQAGLSTRAAAVFTDSLLPVVFANARPFAVLALTLLTPVLTLLDDSLHLSVLLVLIHSVLLCAQRQRLLHDLHLRQRLLLNLHLQQLLAADNRGLEGNRRPAHHNHPHDLAHNDDAPFHLSASHSAAPLLMADWRVEFVLSPSVLLLNPTNAPPPPSNTIEKISQLHLIFFKKRHF